MVPERVTLDNLTAIRAQGELCIDQNPALVVDLSGLKDYSSAAVALLVAWFRHAQQQQKSIEFAQIPSELLSIIELCELDEMLPIKGEA